MARQVVPAEMIVELVVVVVELFAEVAPGMGQDLRAPLVGRVTVLDVRPQCLQVVDSLLSYEHCPSFEADFAERLLVIRL